MGLRGTKGVVVAVSVAVLAIIVPSTLASAHRSRGPTFVAAETCGGQDRKPRTIVISCGSGNFYATHLRYSRYGRRTAQATGSLRYNPCFPDCPAPRFKAYRGSITLSEVRSCHGRRYYTRVAWHFINKRPFADGSASIAPAACA